MGFTPPTPLELSALDTQSPPKFDGVDGRAQSSIAVLRVWGCGAAVGAMPWFVLEELVMRSAVEDAELRVQVSTGELARIVDVNKDTVTRSLAKLRSCGVISVVARGGSTGPTLFAINLPAGLVASDVVAHEGTRRARRPRTDGTLDDVDVQLSLLS